MNTDPFVFVIKTYRIHKCEKVISVFQFVIRLLICDEFGMQLFSKF